MGWVSLAGPMPNCSPLCQLPTTPKLTLPLLSVPRVLIPQIRASLPLCDSVHVFVYVHRTTRASLPLCDSVLRASEVPAS
jgi:hypothetical protein